MISLIVKKWIDISLCAETSEVNYILSINCIYSGGSDIQYVWNKFYIPNISKYQLSTNQIRGIKPNQWPGIFTAQTLKAYDYVARVHLAVAYFERVC